MARRNEQPVSVFDIAEAILSKHDTMTAMKLQKLCYYAQAWHLVWEEKTLFPQRIEAWANGPVCPDLYERHRGKFTVSPGEIELNSRQLDEDERTTIDAVMDFYAHRDAHWLSRLVHAEAPWREARGGIPFGEPCTNEITHGAMSRYYATLSSIK